LSIELVIRQAIVKQKSSEAQEEYKGIRKNKEFTFFSYGKQSLEVSCFYSGPFFSTICEDNKEQLKVCYISLPFFDFFLFRSSSGILKLDKNIISIKSGLSFIDCRGSK